MVAIPHYLLFSEASCSLESRSWRFVLQNVESRRRMVISDVEEAICGERLELLAVVRGLEALSGPARVTLVTKSRYVSRGLRFGMAEWRANDWQWECFGRTVPVKDHDLWQRVDRALLFHQVDCQAWLFAEEATHDDLQASPVPSPTLKTPQAETSLGDSSVPREVVDRPTEMITSAQTAKPLRRAAVSRRRIPQTAPSRKQVCGKSQKSPQWGGLSPTVSSRVSKMRCTLRDLVSPIWPMTTGAA